MNDKSRSNARMVLYIMAGCYLLYSAYGIWGNLSTTSGTQKTLMICFLILFIAAGVGMIIFSGIQMYKIGKEAENVEVAENEEELEIEETNESGETDTEEEVTE